MAIIDTRAKKDNQVFYGKFSEGFMEEWLKIIKALPEKTDIRDGMTLEVGFTLYKLVAIENDQYRLFSVDYENNPFKNFTEDLTIALWIQSEQSTLIKMLGTQAQSLRFDDSITVAKGVLEVGDYYLQRQSSSNNERSNWFIGYQEGENDEISNIYAYEVLVKNPELIKVLPLPEEYLVVVQEEKVVAILDESDEVIFESSNGE